MNRNNNTTIGLDIAKNVFHYAELNRNGTVTGSGMLKRNKVLYFAGLGRELAKLGHTVLLLPARKVKPFVQGNTKLTIMMRWRSPRRRGVLDFTRCR